MKKWNDKLIDAPEKKPSAKARAPKPKPKQSALPVSAPPDEHDEGIVDLGQYRERVRTSVRMEQIGVEVSAQEYDLGYLQFIESHGGKGIDPLSDDAVRLQAQYIALGTHPIDVLKRIVANPYCDIKERISASKTLLEYTTRKVPSQLELSGRNGQALKIDSKQLKSLSDEELSQLEALLSKAQGGAV